MTKVLNVKLIITNDDGSSDILAIDGKDLILFNTECGYEMFNGGKGYMEAAPTGIRIITLKFHDSNKSKWISL